MNIFAIETSCDETSAALVQDGCKVKSLIISSQIKIHSKFFGVVPELASRAHIQNINLVIEQTLSAAKLSFRDFESAVDTVAWTYKPGLAGSLLVGTGAAKTLASVFNKPLIPVNHLDGHLYSAFIENPKIKPPFLGLIVSGGHTELIIVSDFGEHKLLGSTRDDAAGEAFDKAAKMLGLKYPGGPEIDKRASKGNSAAVPFTRPFLKGTHDFSFSGIKTALLNYLKKNPLKSKKHLNDICASFRQAIADTLIFKAFEAAREFKLKTILLGGGVCANSLIRELFMKTGAQENIKVYIPSVIYCMDNAAMIAAAAFFTSKK